MHAGDLIARSTPTWQASGMGRIPDSFLDELLARTDIVELIEARVPLKRAGRDSPAWATKSPMI